MTCIVGLVERDGSVWLGGDRAGVDDSHYLMHTSQPKVFQRGPFLMGYTSSFRMGQLLQYKLAVPDLPTEMDFTEFMATQFVDAVRVCLKDGGYTKITECREKVGVFLVGVAGRLYQFDDDYNVLQTICGYHAVGSGVSVALGSMHATAELKVKPEQRLRMALTAASEFVTGVRPPFDVITIGRGSRSDPAR